jgi:hypothetical protein
VEPTPSSRTASSISRSSAPEHGCPAYFASSTTVAGDELKVYRCDWGWYVKSPAAECRSRYLDEAFEQVLGHTLDRPALRAMIELLDRELTAERDGDGKTASRTLLL